MRNLVTRSALLAVTLTVLLFATHSRAQDLASITGTVADASGAVVPGASVLLENRSTNTVFKATTNAQGSYTIANVAPGPGYRITFSASGFKSIVITGIYLSVTTTRTQNVKLAVGTESQTVEVSASAENVTLNTTDATVGNNFQVQELQDLPVQDRDNPAALFIQQPGVTTDGAVTGARTDQSNVTVDGIEVNDNATGQFGTIVGDAPVDSVQEFRAVTADPLSSSGQGGGGQYDLVTNSGTNSFHGNVNEYHRDTDLEANNWFNNNIGLGRPPLIRNQFGGNIGGPVWRNKVFFFFDYNGRRDTLTGIENRTVPIGTNTSGYRGGEVSYVNNSGNIETLNSAQVAALDPNGIGWNQAELALFQKRYPVANDLTGDLGDSVNTAGYRFNAPFPFSLKTFVQRVDYTINDQMKIFGRGTFKNENETYDGVQFPGDPETFPFIDKSYGWVVGHTWTIGTNKLNQAAFGENDENFAFNIVYNPQGADQYSFTGLSGPYFAANNSQAREYPIYQVRDDFSWEKGNHSFTFGGTFKWETPDEFAAENYNFPSVGITGNTYLTTLSPAQRPSDIDTSTANTTIYDSAFSTALGVFADLTSNFDYNNKGAVLQQGSGLSLNYRYYETELYFGDTWKLTPDLNISYGVRYQNYTVPYETRGFEAVPQLTSNGTESSFTADKYFKAREVQSAAGISTNTSVPFMQFVYGGKKNNGPGYFGSSNKNFAPRISFNYSPAGDKKSVFRGGASVIFDHSEINALQFLQLQSSQLFEAGNGNYYGVPSNPTKSLQIAPRFSGISSPPAAPAAPAVSSPYVPWVFGGAPVGLSQYAANSFSIVMDPNLKTPYNIQYDFGVEHEFGQGFILKVDYVGRLGRRLLAEADGTQLIDFPDNTGGSTQSMAQAEGAMVTQLRKNAKAGPLADVYSLSPQPWFEDELGNFSAAVNYYEGASTTNNTQAVAYAIYPYPQRGDFADTMQAIAADGYLGPNIGMASQFASNTIWTNKGSSNYNGLLVTLHKNAGFGLRFDLNYTWSHSIDNVSSPANFVAGSVGFGFICDVTRPRECRGKSDFNIASDLNGNFIYELPFGRGKSVGATVPLWANEFIGGWEFSGTPTWTSGSAYNALSNAFVAGFATEAPATLLAPTGVVKTRVHGGEGQLLSAYANSSAADLAYTGPTGLNIGSRNNLSGPGYFDLDLGLGKTFPIYEDKANLKFRCDAFNATNHPNFAYPGESIGGVVTGSADITESNGLPFGTIGATVNAARVLQGSLRLEF